MSSAPAVSAAPSCTICAVSKAKLPACANAPKPPVPAMARGSERPAWKCQGIIETELRARGYRRIAGADEVGRGSLFGAVVAAAVILNPDVTIRGLNDSKQIDPD